MDSNTKQLCRVCLQNSEDSVNIFDEFQDPTIASILVQHFWFQVHKNDGMTEWLCPMCWVQIKAFHIFYNKIKFLHANYYSPTDVGSSNIIRKEQSATPKDEALEFDLNIVKCEETELIEEVDLPISKDRSDCGESANSQTSDDEDQSSNEKKPHVGDVKITGKETLTPEQNAQIREFFSMKCEICSGAEFETFLRVRKHYRRVHKTDGYIMCCGKKFHRRDMILNHIRLHVQPDAHRCDQCGKCFTKKQSLKEHIDNHSPLDSHAHTYSSYSNSFTEVLVQNRHSKIGETFPSEKWTKSKIVLPKQWKNGGEEDRFIIQLIKSGKVNKFTKPASLQSKYPAMFADFSTNVVRNHLNVLKKSNELCLEGENDEDEEAATDNVSRSSKVSANSNSESNLIQFNEIQFDSTIVSIAHKNYPVLCDTYEDPQTLNEKVMLVLCLPSGASNTKIELSDDGTATIVKYTWSKTMFEMEDLFRSPLSRKVLNIDHPKILCLKNALEKNQKGVDSLIKIHLPIKVQTVAGSWNHSGVKREDGTIAIIAEFEGYIKKYNKKLTDSNVTFNW